MVKNYNNYFYLNKFFKKIISKKQYIKKLKNKIYLLNKTKNLNGNSYNKKDNFIITYVIEIFFSQTNTLLHVTNSIGKLKFFCSAGDLLFKGKSKKARTPVLANIINILIKKLKFLKDRPVLLRLKNIGFKRNWVIKKLKKKLFIKTIAGFNIYSHNGCRKKKVRYRKFNIIKKWLSLV